MTMQGRVENGVVVFQGGVPLPEGTLVEVKPMAPVIHKGPPYPVSEEQKAALLKLIGICKTDNPPNDEEVEQIIDEYRMKKYG